MDTGTGETLRDNGHDGKLLADFGYMTEGEWRAFQMSRKFTAEVGLKQKRAIEVRATLNAEYL
jgi:hypothetical protein